MDSLKENEYLFAFISSFFSLEDAFTHSISWYDEKSNFKQKISASVNQKGQ